jgi:hypothetical protein
MNDPLKPLRKSFRAWRNLRRLEREEAYYRTLFRRRGLSIPDDCAVSRAIRSKYPDMKPVPKGGFNSIAVYHNYNWENESLRPALAKFGRVHHYDWGEKFDHGAKEWNTSLKAEMNRDLVEFVRRRVREAPVHFLFAYISGGLVSPAIVEELSVLRIPMVNLALNDKEAFVGKIRSGQATGARDICRHFDLCWTSTRDALEKYCVEGALPVYLPEGANPEVHRPYDVEKTFDVTFVGQRYGNRPAVIDALKSAGIRVEAFGPGWPNGPLPTGEMVKMYSRSRINLGFGGVVGHKDTYHLKGRDFEVPMSGGLYLTEQHEELESVYEVGKEIVTYSGIDDLIARIRWLLSNPEEAERIRRAGRERSLREHTWEMRFEKIFGLLGLVE